MAHVALTEPVVPKPVVDKFSRFCQVQAVFDIRRGQIDGGAPHSDFEPGIGRRRRYPVARLLHRRIWRSDNDNHWIHHT